jgi:hypothetical protein
VLSHFLTSEDKNGANLMVAALQFRDSPLQISHHLGKCWDAPPGLSIGDDHVP